MVHTKVMNTSHSLPRSNINGTTYLKHIESLIHYKTRLASYALYCASVYYVNKNLD